MKAIIKDTGEPVVVIGAGQDGPSGYMYRIQPAEGAARWVPACEVVVESAAVVQKSLTTAARAQALPHNKWMCWAHLSKCDCQGCRDVREALAQIKEEAANGRR